MAQNRVQLPPLLFPVKGKHQGWGQMQQPQQTTPDCLNVIPWNQQGRGIGGTRPGLTKVWQYQFGTTNSRFIQHLSQADWLNASSNSTSFAIVVSGGNLYQCERDTEPTGPVTGGTGIFSAGRRVEGAAYGGKVYLTDGIVAKQLDLQTATCSTWNGGTGFPSDMRLACNWMGSIVLALEEGNPERLYTSRVGDPLDWDTGGVVTPDMPTASNINWRMGQLGNPVTALIPSIDQRLVIGQDHAIHVMVGYPADGGIMRAVSEHTGILTPDSWTEADGAIYFVGTGDFYRMPLSGAPENLSSVALHDPFDDLPNRGYWINCEYDPVNVGVWIFIVKDVTWDDARHHFFDIRTGGFFPVEIPSAIAPSRSLFWDGRAETRVDREMWIGCRDGYVRRFDATVFNDDGTYIDSYAWLGPAQYAAGRREIMVNGIDIWPGQVTYASNWACNLTLQSGSSLTQFVRPTATATLTSPFTLDGADINSVGVRQSGWFHWVKIRNTNSARIWSLEQLDLRPQGGQNL